jgi:hypothetical protein
MRLIEISIFVVESEHFFKVTIMAIGLRLSRNCKQQPEISGGRTKLTNKRVVGTPVRLIDLLAALAVKQGRVIDPLYATGP